MNAGSLCVSVYIILDTPIIYYNFSKLLNSFFGNICFSNFRFVNDKKNKQKNKKKQLDIIVSIHP